MSILDDYHALLPRYLDDPDAPELREAMLVCGDGLSSIGDPRGALITFEHALREAEGRRALELRRAMYAHLLERGGSMLGELEPILRDKRALGLELRGGQIYGAQLDARYLRKTANVPPVALVRRLVEAPIAGALRQLAVRVRTEGDFAEVLNVVRDGFRPPPALERLSILTVVRPSGVSTGIAARTSALLAQFGDLHLLALITTVQTLPAEPSGRPEHLLEAVRHAAPPVTPAARRILGRALFSTVDAVREAALTRLGELGSQAASLLDLVLLQLQPDFAFGNPLHAIACLRALGEHARRALPLLISIPGRTSHYAQPVRRAAGSAAHAILAALR